MNEGHAATNMHGGAVTILEVHYNPLAVELEAYAARAARAVSLISSIQLIFLHTLLPGQGRMKRNRFFRIVPVPFLALKAKKNSLEPQDLKCQSYGSEIGIEVRPSSTHLI